MPQTEHPQTQRFDGAGGGASLERGWEDNRVGRSQGRWPCAKGFDGRIDDANAGWKGRGLWTTTGDRTPWLMEGGKGSLPRAVHFQLRPDPLAH
jgi:hypothetical protein